MSFADLITSEWLELFEECKAKGEDLADSIFWRLSASGTLPDGVNQEDQRVKKAIEEINEAIKKKREKSEPSSLEPLLEGCCQEDKHEVLAFQELLQLKAKAGKK